MPATMRLSPVMIEAIGFCAGTLTTFCWLPQAIKIIKSRDTKAISLPTQMAFTAGCFLWMIFGFFVGSPSVAIFNVITTCLAGVITALKLRYG
jgi:MtN3 and saliva related transmembrane protein